MVIVVLANLLTKGTFHGSIFQVSLEQRLLLKRSDQIAFNLRDNRPIVPIGKLNHTVEQHFMAHVKVLNNLNVSLYKGENP